MQTSITRTIEEPVKPASGGSGVPQGSSQGLRTIARILLAAFMLALGLYILWNYVRALVWAVVLAIALWPLFERVRRRVPRRLSGEVLPLVFVALVGLVFLLPFVLLTLEAVREAHQLVDYGKQVQQSGVPVPDFVTHLPYGAKQASDWWNTNLAHSGWYQDALRRIDTNSNRELGRNIGEQAIHRVVLADHFVRPNLIGGATKLPFLWVLLGILGGVESFGLLGLFVGPATMAALILLWREFTQAPEATEAVH